MITGLLLLKTMTSYQSCYLHILADEAQSPTLCTVIDQSQRCIPPPSPCDQSLSNLSDDPVPPIPGVYGAQDGFNNTKTQSISFQIVLRTLTFTKIAQNFCIQQHIITVKYIKSQICTKSAYNNITEIVIRKTRVRNKSFHKYVQNFTIQTI